MKILSIGYPNTRNTYVENLNNSLKNYCSINCDYSTLFSKNLKFDIIHIQWPDSIAPRFFKRLIALGPLGKYYADYILNRFKNNGAKVVVTFHDITPHVSPIMHRSLFNAVLDKADAIVHLGKRSQHLLSPKYTKAIHTVIHHGNYIVESIDESMLLNYDTSKNEEMVALVPGKIRNSEEENLIINIAHSLSKLKIKVKILNGYLPKWQIILKNIFRSIEINKRNAMSSKNIDWSRAVISFTQLSNEVKRSYFIIIPRINTLNSGLAPLAYSFGKVAIGTKNGNIGYYLNMMNNPTFDPYDQNSIEAALQNVLNENLKQKGMENFRFARTKLSWKTIGEAHYDLYKSLA